MELPIGDLLHTYTPIILLYSLAELLATPHALTLSLSLTLS